MSLMDITREEAVQQSKLQKPELLHFYREAACFLIDFISTLGGRGEACGRAESTKSGGRYIYVRIYLRNKII